MYVRLLDTIYLDPEECYYYLKHVRPGQQAYVVAYAALTSGEYNCCSYDAYEEEWYCCYHGQRSIGWNVTGAGVANWQQVNYQYLGPGYAEFLIEASETGGEVIIEAEYGELTEGGCETGASHSGNHAGASGEVKLTFFHAVITSGAAANSDPDYDYETERAQEETFTAVVKGGFEPEVMDWRSYFYAGGQAQDLIVENLSGQVAWAGQVVTDTMVRCLVQVKNPYVAVSSLNGSLATVTIEAAPRPGWELYPTFEEDFDTSHHALDDDGWSFPISSVPSDMSTWQSDPDNYVGTYLERDSSDPTYIGYLFHGLNTNYDSVYRWYNTEIITPIYGNEDEPFDIDYQNFSSIVGKVLHGPNKSLFYNTSPSMYKINRGSLFNKWVRPSASAPDSTVIPGPAGDPNWQTTHNYYLLQGNSTFGQPACGRSLPGNALCDCEVGACDDNGHTRWTSLKYHEGRGTPGPNDEELGHQSRIEWYLENHETADVLKRIEGVVASGVDDLRAANEMHRAEANMELYDHTKKLDFQPHDAGSVLDDTDPDMHNFSRDMHVFRQTTRTWIVIHEVR